MLPKLLRYLSRAFSPPGKRIRLTRHGYYHYGTGEYFPGRAGDPMRVRAHYDGGNSFLLRKRG